jgi:hypothetical protein
MCCKGKGGKGRHHKKSLVFGRGEQIVKELNGGRGGGGGEGVIRNYFFFLADQTNASYVSHIKRCHYSTCGKGEWI